MTTKVKSPSRWPEDGPIDPVLDLYCKKEFSDAAAPAPDYERQGIGGGEQVGRRLVAAYCLGVFTDDEPIDDQVPENHER